MFIFSVMTRNIGIVDIELKTVQSTQNDVEVGEEETSNPSSSPIKVKKH